MRLTLQTRNLSGTIANVRAADHILQRDVKKVVRKWGKWTLRRLRELCPVDTTFMREHSKVVFTEQGYVYEVGWDELDFINAGLAFYPVYQEFGTSKMPAQPCLYPAAAEARPMFRNDLASSLRRSVRRLNRRGR